MDKSNWPLVILLGLLITGAIFAIYLMAGGKAALLGTTDTEQLEQEMEERQQDLRLKE